MRAPGKRSAAFFVFLFTLLLFFEGTGFAAAIETPTGKKIPGKIVDEGEKKYKIGTELPGGGRIIFNVDKDKVDPHGTVPGKGRIEDIKGKAEIRRVGTIRFLPASKNTIVAPGDEIRTLPGSEVVITLESTAVNGIGEDTRYKLTSLEMNPETKAVNVEINMPQGKLWSEVGKLKTKDSRFRIETPSAVTGVRGTVFRVEVERVTGETNVSVIAGAVGVGSKDVDVPEVILNKKETLIVKRGQEPRKLSASELLSHIAEIIEEWAKKSDYFKAVTALAGIGEVEQIEIEPTLPEAERQRIYDSIQAGWEKASEDFFQIDKALKLFYLDFARFPTVEEGGLSALVSSTGTPQWNGPYTEPQYLNDHYGVPYNYAVLKDAHGDTVIEITTFGYDKEPGTQDDRKKILREEDARRWEDSKSYR